MIKIDLDKKKRYLLACSYGPDSMALFDLLLKNGYSFEVAHVNYGLRLEADDETEHLQSFCDKKGIKFHVLREKPLILSNIEEKCREIRYLFFKKTIENCRLDALLVAHNQDDLIETYFLQKNRHNIVEYYGLEKDTFLHGYRVIRPLLNVSKAKLKAYNDKNNVPYAIDSSNLENKFLRNKIRHSMVEKMTETDRTEIIFEINNANEKMISRHKFLKSSLNREAEELLSFSDEDLAYYFTTLVRTIIPGYELSLRQVKEFRNALISTKPNIVIKLRKGLCFIKSYNHVNFEILNKETNFNFRIDNPCEFDCDFFYLNFTEDSKNRNVNIDDYPLTIRNANGNDEIKIKNYSVKMRRQFIDWKMPSELRKRWPIILDKNGNIIYVPKYNPDFKVDSKINFFVKI